MAVVGGGRESGVCVARGSDGGASRAVVSGSVSLKRQRLITSPQLTEQPPERRTAFAAVIVPKVLSKSPQTFDRNLAGNEPGGLGCKGPGSTGVTD